MYELFFQKLNEKISFTEEEQAIIRNYLTPRKLRKKQYLLQEGDVCKTIAFVVKGTLREYNVDDKGNEHILQFALDGWVISDLYSFMTGEPATYNIDALEDSELLLITRHSQEELLKRVPKYLFQDADDRGLYGYAKTNYLYSEHDYRRKVFILYRYLSQYCTACTTTHDCFLSWPHARNPQQSQEENCQ